MDASESKWTVGWTRDEFEKREAMFGDDVDEQLPGRCINVDGHIAKVVVHGEDCDEVAAKIVEAMNSDPLAAAEGDLLGEALSQCRVLEGECNERIKGLEGADPGGPCHEELVMWEARLDSVAAVLAKAARKEMTP